MRETIDKTPFEQLDAKLHEKEFEDYGKVLNLDFEDTLEALHILNLLIRGYGMSREPHAAFPSYGTYPRCLRVAKRISEMSFAKVPVQSNAFDTKPPIFIDAETDIQPIWQDALQDDQQSYYAALQQHKAHLGEEGYDWTKEYSDKILEALDSYYDLSNNMENLGDTLKQLRLLSSTTISKHIILSIY